MTHGTWAGPALLAGVQEGRRLPSEPGPTGRFTWAHWAVPSILGPFITEGSDSGNARPPQTLLRDRLGPEVLTTSMWGLAEPSSWAEMGMSDPLGFTIKKFKTTDMSGGADSRGCC